MPAFRRGLFKHEGYAGFYPEIAVLGNALFFCDAVCGGKTYSVNVVNQSVRIFLDDFDGFVPVNLINFQGHIQADCELLQKHYGFVHALDFVVAQADFHRFFEAYASDLV